MTSKKRTALLLALATLALAAGAFWYLRRPNPLTPAQLASYLPPAEGLEIWADVDAIRRSGLLDKIAGSAVAEDPDYKAFVEQTGFNYRSDLDRLLAHSAGTTQLVVLQGRFDWDKLRRAAAQQGGRCEGEICSVPSSRPGRHVSFRELRRDVMGLAFADQPAAARVLSKSTRRPAELPDAPVWAILPAGQIRSMPLPAGTKLFVKALSSAERAVFTIAPRDGRFEIAMDVSCQTAEDAAVLRAELDAITSMLKKLIALEKQTPNPADLSGVLTAGVFERFGRHVIGRWPVSQPFLEALAGRS